MPHYTPACVTVAWIRSTDLHTRLHYVGYTRFTAPISTQILPAYTTRCLITLPALPHLTPARRLPVCSMDTTLLIVACDCVSGCHWVLAVLRAFTRLHWLHYRLPALPHAHTTVFGRSCPPFAFVHVHHLLHHCTHLLPHTLHTRLTHTTAGYVHTCGSYATTTFRAVHSSPLLTTPALHRSSLFFFAVRWLLISAGCCVRSSFSFTLPHLHTTRTLRSFLPARFTHTAPAPHAHRHTTVGRFPGLHLGSVSTRLLRWLGLHYTFRLLIHYLLLVTSGCLDPYC